MNKSKCESVSAINSKNGLHQMRNGIVYTVFGIYLFDYSFELEICSARLPLKYSLDRFVSLTKQWHLLPTTGI